MKKYGRSQFFQYIWCKVKGQKALSSIIKKSGDSIREDQEKKVETENNFFYAADDWSEDCLEYFFNNKIFFPGIVSP